MKKKVYHLRTSATFDRRLYETDDYVRTYMENQIGVNMGNYIVENKDKLPIKFREVKDEYNVTILGDILMVDTELKRIIELIVESDNITEILHYIQKYKMRDGSQYFERLSETGNLNYEEMKEVCEKYLE